MHLGGGRAVALKFPLAGQQLDGQVRERFLREARAAGALDHSNICSIHEAGQTESGQLFIAMPLYDGETVKARVARAGPLPIAEALAIAVQIARGLQAAHRASIVHRDLKPANVMILPDGGVKILDFGVARIGDVTLTKSRDTLGTVSYMAPEQIRGEQVDGRADLWSLGVLLYEMLTARRPFEGDQEIGIAHAILHANPVRPSALRPEIGPELDALVLGLLEKKRDRRRDTADAVVAELTALQSLPASRDGRRNLRFTTSTRRSLLWGATFALVASAAAGSAWMYRARGATGSAEPRFVAVLPFDEATGRDDGRYLGVALADEIGMRLSRLRSVVMSEPDAGAVVRGSVRRVGDEVVLRVELFDVDQNRQLWTREYTGPSNSVLALQRSATEGIVDALRIDLPRIERAALLRDPTTSADAYDLYLRGRVAHIGAAPDDSSPRRMASLERAQSYYARARESDPGFAAPRAQLALSHLALARYDGTNARRDQARIEAEAALRLEPGMPEAHEALASYWLLLGDAQKAIGELEMTLTERPNAPRLLSLLALNLFQLGRLEEAASTFERASRLEPRDKHVHAQAAVTYARLRRYDEAIVHWDRLIAMDSARDPTPQVLRGFNYLRRGNVDSLEAGISRIPLRRGDDGTTTYAHYTVHNIRRHHAEAVASLDSAGFALIADGIFYRPVSLLRAQSLERMGDVKGARAAYETARLIIKDSLAAHPRDASIHVALGLAYAGLRRRADAMHEARVATKLVPVSENSPSATAFLGGAVEIFAQLGETAAALELIELLLAMPAGREISVPLLRLDPAFDHLRGDPRFEALLNRFSKN